MRTSSVEDQISSSIVNSFNVDRISSEANKLDLQDASFEHAINHVNKVRDFIGKPESILGNPNTKHGETAEQVEVCIRNARDALEGKVGTATFEGVGRTASEDYLINGTAVQSKFINGANNGLSHVMKHMDKYSHFGRDGSYYHIPKDQHSLINKIINGDQVDDLNEKSIQAIKNKIAEIEAKSGKPFNEIVRPGVSDYAEVQQGKVVKTLDNHEKLLKERNEEIKDEIRSKHRANLNEGLKAAGAAAAVGATLSLGSILYKKHKQEGKNVFKGELNAQDWKEAGLGALKGGVVGGVTGAAVYGLTNCAGLSAPLAGAFVTATKGVKHLTHDLYNGDISFEEFQINAIFLCADSAGVGLATIAGQMLIPIPIVGSVVGALAGKIVCKLLFAEDKKLAQQMEDSMSQLLGEVDQAYQAVFNKINSEFDKIASLREQAFDINSNISVVQSSIALARAYGVSEHKVIKNEDELHKFLFN